MTYTFTPSGAGEADTTDGDDSGAETEEKVMHNTNDNNIPGTRDRETPIPWSPSPDR